jgi:hypothetical protein
MNLLGVSHTSVFGERKKSALVLGGQASKKKHPRFGLLCLETEREE